MHSSALFFNQLRRQNFHVKRAPFWFIGSFVRPLTVNQWRPLKDRFQGCPSVHWKLVMISFSLATFFQKLYCDLKLELINSPNMVLFFS